jgi:cob(I)alamin adenosyltransferase
MYLQEGGTLLCKYAGAGIFVDPLVIKYLNRLSDHLFVLSRYIGHLLNAPEIPWKPRV